MNQSGRKKCGENTFLRKNKNKFNVIFLMLMLLLLESLHIFLQFNLNHTFFSVPNKVSSHHGQLI